MSYVGCIPQDVTNGVFQYYQDALTLTNNMCTSICSKSFYGFAGTSNGYFEDKEHPFLFLWIIFCMHFIPVDKTATAQTRTATAAI